MKILYKNNLKREGIRKNIEKSRKIKEKTCGSV